MRTGMLLPVLACAASALAGPAEDYVDAQLRVVRQLTGQVPALTRVADDAAERLVAGGRMFLAGEKGMVAELHGRAGGLCGAKRLAPGKTLLGPNDVVLWSSYGSGPGEVAFGQGRALWVLFAPKHHAIFKAPLRPNCRAIPVDVPTHGCLRELPDGKRAIRLAAPATAVAQWAFTAELIGACRRRGKQLAVYLSIHLDEGRKRYKRTRGLLFEPGPKPKPVPAGQYAKAFLADVRTALEAVRRGEAAKIRKAAAWIREAEAAGHRVYRQLHGHLPPYEAGAPGDPACFTHTVRPPLGEKGADWIRDNLKKGDVYLLVGYQQNEDAMAAAANALGARTIFITSLPPSAKQAANPLHLYVDPHWPLTDACLELAGYDVKACPLSAILGLTCYHAIAAEAVAPND